MLSDSFFFFQAEDGIRDVAVTGVQTCALPISVPPGDYWIRIEVNPGFTPGAGEPCPAYDPLAGLCHNFAESDYTNNVAMVRITLPTDRPGKTGFGAGSGDNARDNEVDDENRKTEN